MNIDPYSQVIYKNHANPQCTWCSGCKTSDYHPSMSYHVVNFRQLYPIQQNPKFHKEQDWRMNQHVCEDVKILNINDREHLANMHTQQPMKWSTYEMKQYIKIPKFPI